MYSQLEQSTNLVDSVFELLDDMNLGAVKDQELLVDLYGYCAKIGNNRFLLLSYIKNMIDEYGVEGRHPLISELYKLFLQEYDVLFESPLKLKLKVQIDSLSENSTAKDEFIHLMLHCYRQKGGNAYLIAPEKNVAQIKGSSLFTSIAQKQIMPLLENLKTEIQDLILHEDSTNPRIQIIIRQQEHYCVLDFDKVSGQCLVLDAAGDARQNNLLDVLQTIPEILSIVYVHNFTYEHDGVAKTTTLQKDYYSCAVFALDHIEVCAQQENLHDILIAKAHVESAKVKHISWFDLPTPFVRNAQSPTFKNKYCTTTHDETAKEYFDLYDFKKTVSCIKLKGVHLLTDILEKDCQEILDGKILTSFNKTCQVSHI